MSPQPFKSGAAFRTWLEKHHATAPELIVLFYKRDSGRGGITYAEALDEALCFGWIDGVRTGRDAESYTIRFTPRRPNSNWSHVNVRHVQRLLAAKRMAAPGRAAFAARQASRTGIYSFENRPEALPAEFECRFRTNRPAWTFFQQLPPGHRRIVIWWVVSAKQVATRERRFARLVEQSAAQKRVDLLKPFGDRE